MEGQFLIRFIREYLPILIFLFGVAIVAGGWVVFESARSLLKRDEVEKLRRRVDELEREQIQFRAPVPPPRKSPKEPMVLATRWVRKGGAATSSDGGCLVLVDDLFPNDSRALITVRIDGAPVRQRYEMEAGESLELEGKSGFYTVELGAISTNEAQISGWLRSHHG